MKKKRDIKSQGVVIYQTDDKQTNVEVRLEDDTVWLTQKQMAALFGRDRVAITQHIGNIFKEKELDKLSVCKDFLHTASDGKQYQTACYNLDVIISVGYRIKSKQGIRFRIWATSILKKHLVQGYTLNEKRLQKNMQELEQAISIIKVTGNSDKLQLSEAKGLLDIITNYTHAFIVLNKYDSDNLSTSLLEKKITHEINYKEARGAIEKLKKELISIKEASDLFGKEKDESFKGILGNIVQTFGKKYLYPSIEEQGAHLLYFVIKNHPFTDGNKRIGAFLFVWFLSLNKHLLRSNGERKINDNALVALALLVAQSNTSDKEIMIRLIINLINT